MLLRMLPYATLTGRPESALATWREGLLKLIAYTLIHKRCWDGAIGGYNNPVLAGLIEALANGISLDAVRVLSIGTGSVRLPPHPITFGALALYIHRLWIQDLAF